jgi:hypothetical protein
VNNWQLLLAAGCGLLVVEATDVCGRLAIRLVRWAARRRYAGEEDRSATRSEELAALICDRPGQLLKLCTALGFTLAALASAGRRAAQPAGRRSIARASRRGGYALAFGIGIVSITVAFSLGRDVGIVAGLLGLESVATALIVKILVFAAVQFGVVDHAHGLGRQLDGARIGAPRVWFEDMDALPTPVRTHAPSGGPGIACTSTRQDANDEQRVGDPVVILRFAWEGLDDEGPSGW